MRSIQEEIENSFDQPAAIEKNTESILEESGVDSEEDPVIEGALVQRVQNLPVSHQCQESFEGRNEMGSHRLTSKKPREYCIISLVFSQWVASMGGINSRYEIDSMSRREENYIWASLRR